MGRPRAEEHRDTRGDIVAAALDLFSRHGFDATSVRMIAGAAGVRESALYHHFTDKSALLSDMVSEISQRRSEGMARILAETDGHDLKRVLERLVKQLATLMQSEKPRKFVQMMMLSGANPATAEVREKLSGEGAAQLTAFFRALQTRELVRKELDPRVIAHIFFSAMFMGFHAPFSPTAKLLSDAALQRFLRQHVDILARGIGT